MAHPQKGSYKHHQAGAGVESTGKEEQGETKKVMRVIVRKEDEGGWIVWA